MKHILVILVILWPAWAGAQAPPVVRPPSALLRTQSPLRAPLGSSVRWRPLAPAGQARAPWLVPFDPPARPVTLAPPPSASSMGRPGELPPSQRTLVQSPGRPSTPVDANELVQRFSGASPTFTTSPVVGARPLRELVSGAVPTSPDGVRACPGGAGCPNILVRRVQATQGHRSATATIGACRLGLGCQSSHTTVGLRAASGNARSSAEATIGPDAGHAVGHGAGSGTISDGRRNLLDATVRHATETTPGVPSSVGAALRETMQRAHSNGAAPIIQTPIAQRRRP